MNPSPTWGPKFDKHLKTILAQNKHRWVRCTASMAPARMAERTGQLDDARKQYRQYIKDFDGRHKYQFQNVESQARLVATQRLNKLMKQQ